MEYRYRPEGVCSREFVIDIDEKTKKINKLKIIGGCPGNTIGVSTLVEGMDIDQVIEKLKGIKCGLKGTSCPDQVTKALESIKEKL